MNNETKSTVINVAALIELVISVAIMSFGLIKGFLTSSQANIVVGIGLFLFWMLSDVAEPFLCGRLADTTLERKEAYVKYIGLDLIGYAGILYFLAGVGNNGKTGGILGAVVYIVTMKPKKNQRDIFLGYVVPETEESEEPEESALEEEIPESNIVEGQIVDETDKEEE